MSTKRVPSVAASFRPQYGQYHTCNTRTFPSSWTPSSGTVYAPESVANEWWEDPERREAVYARVKRESRRERRIAAIVGWAVAIYLAVAIWQWTHEDNTGQDCYQDFDGFGYATVCEEEPPEY